MDAKAMNAKAMNAKLDVVKEKSQGAVCIRVQLKTACIDRYYLGRRTLSKRASE